MMAFGDMTTRLAFQPTGASRYLVRSIFQAKDAPNSSISKRINGVTISQHLRPKYDIQQIIDSTVYYTSGVVTVVDLGSEPSAGPGTYHIIKLTASSPSHTFSSPAQLLHLDTNASAPTLNINGIDFNLNQIGDNDTSLGYEVTVPRMMISGTITATGLSGTHMIVLSVRST